MTRTARLTALAQRVAAEFKTIRSTDLGGFKYRKITKAQYDALGAAKDPNTAYLLNYLASTIFSDTFTRASSTTSMGSTTQGGFAWTALSGTWGIASNRAYTPAGTAATNLAAVVNDGVSDGLISATIGAVGTDYTTGGVIFRATDDNNYFLITTSGVLYKKVAGVLTNLGSAAPVIAAGAVLSVFLAGPSIVVKYNGVNIITATDSFNQSATRHGLRSYGPSGMTWSAASHTTF